MKTTSLTFRIIALIGLLIFVTVQFFLIYNTYRINEEHFFSKEKEIIDNEYSKSITNDRVYPGGQAIIDSFYLRNRDSLERLYPHSPKEFSELSQSMMDSIFTSLIKHNNLEKKLDTIIKIKYKLANNYKYALVVKKFDITFQKNQYIQLYPFFKNAQSFERIGGSLPNPNSTNLITSLTVSSASDKSYRITFQLYIESSNKTWLILKKMMPTFLLSIASIITIVSLFAITINNWFKQKKLAEMQFDFINSISHEFNTPLTAIIIANKTLQNDKVFSQTEKLKSMTDIIQRQTTRLSGLFQQTLRTTKSNQSFLNKRKENIQQVTEKIINDYKTNLNKNTTITFQSYIDHDSTLEMDNFWFTTMLQNLIDNGIKYNNSELKEIDITLYDRNEHIILKIKDNGIGMAQEITKKIFQKFYRYNDKTTKAGGLGLGLFYVRECTQLHGWDIDVESNIGKGSEFIVTLR